LAPQWPLVFSLPLRFLRGGFFAYSPRYKVGFGPKSGGADGKPTTEPFQKSRLKLNRLVVNMDDLGRFELTTFGL
jgi:hypothetical protein